MQPQETTQEQTQNNKEYNFRQLEAKYQREIEQERSARIEAEKRAQEVSEKTKFNNEDDDDDSEPYVDKKKLNKSLNKYGEQIKQQTQTEIQKAVQMAINQERKENWLKQNSDFQDVLNHAEKLIKADPELAETILQMPDNFERQKLVYKSIKAMGLHQEKPKEPSVQEKIDANRRSPYYQPSGVGNAPYSNVSDFSQKGQKQAYDKMQELKNRLRI